MTEKEELNIALSKNEALVLLKFLGKLRLAIINYFKTRRTASSFEY